MDFDRILPLLVLYVFWRLLSRTRRVKEKTSAAVPLDREYGFAWLNENNFDRPYGPGADAVPPDVQEIPPMAAADDTAATAELFSHPEPPVEMVAGTAQESAGMVRPAARSFAHLRRAVIWSEILAKPRGLRGHME